LGNALAPLDGIRGSSRWCSRHHRGVQNVSSPVAQFLPAGGKLADVIGIGEGLGGIELVGVEFGSLIGVVQDVSEDHGSAGMPASSHLQVSSHQDGSVEFGRQAVSEIDVGCIWEVPQDTLGHAGRESACAVTLQTLEVHGGGVDTDVSTSMNVDQNSLALAAVAEVDGVYGIDFLVFVGPDVEDLDFIVVGTHVFCLSIYVAPVFVLDFSFRREGLPVLRFLV
jgi:hypothetical protein